MISPDEAEAIILGNCPVLPAEDWPIGNCLHRVLRESVHADRDQPPFSRVTMDGFAVRFEDWRTGSRKFSIQGSPQAAGTPQRDLLDAGGCVEIMTGAPLPRGSDAVVPYEETSVDGGVMTVSSGAEIKQGQAIHPRGSDFKSGTCLLGPGRKLSGKEIAVAVSAGATTLSVSRLPTIALVSTGDELVDVGEPVAAHQIRRSNDYALGAAIQACGYTRVKSFHFPDVKDELRTQIGSLLADFDVLIVTGGISQGKFDFLPSVLMSLGVEKRFQGIRQRPGKPFWFGTTTELKPVFALPGNPVSAYVCLHRYVLPALEAMSAKNPDAPEYLPLSSPVIFKPDLAYLLPVKREVSLKGIQVAVPNPVNTSGDYAGLLETQGFVELPFEKTDFPAGYVARFWPWR